MIFYENNDQTGVRKNDLCLKYFNSFLIFGNFFYRNWFKI